MTKESAAALFSRIAQPVAAIFAGGAISWAAWMSIELNSKLDESHVQGILAQAPYLKDKEDIHHQLKRISAMVDTQFAQIITNNTTAIVRLEEQMKHQKKQSESIERVLQLLDAKLEARQ